MQLNKMDRNLRQCNEPLPSSAISRRRFRRRSADIVRQSFGRWQGSSGQSPHRGEQGLSLVELIVTVAILAILASVAYPIARFQIQRQKESVLRDDLWQMRHAIDKYKDAADRGAIRTSVESFGYPPDLDTLVKGVNIKDHNVKFLRAIPVDPMTGKQDWVLRSMQDDPDSDSWGGQNAFDVHSNSQGTALDGTKYSTW